MKHSELNVSIVLFQAFGLERFRKNCHQMAGGFNYVLTAMFTPTPPAPTGGGTNRGGGSGDTGKGASRIVTGAGTLYAACQPSSN